MSARVAIGILTALVLAGCGGSGDGDGDGGPTITPSSAADITSANALTIAAAAVGSSLQAGGLSSFAEFAPIGASTLTATSAQLFSVISDFQQAGLDSLQTNKSAPITLQAVISDTLDCLVSGSQTVTLDAVDPQNFSAGDSVAVEYSLCDEGAGAVLDGTYRMSITELSGDLLSGLFLFAIDVEAVSFTVTLGEGAVSTNGSLSITIDSRISPRVIVMISSPSLTVVNDGETHTLSNFAVTQTVDASATSFMLEMSGSLSSSVFVGTVNFETTAALQGLGDDFAFDGELVIMGAGSATIRVVAIDSVSVVLEIDLDGDSVIDDTIETTWEELIASASV